eukprot:214552-Lingulodinium_polyedra.AAC.1
MLPGVRRLPTHQLQKTRDSNTYPDGARSIGNVPLCWGKYTSTEDVRWLCGVDYIVDYRV